LLRPSGYLVATILDFAENPFGSRWAATNYGNLMSNILEIAFRGGGSSSPRHVTLLPCRSSGLSLLNGLHRRLHVEVADSPRGNIILRLADHGLERLKRSLSALEPVHRIAQHGVGIGVSASRYLCCDAFEQIRR
jgi:hypothetical protein